jgi:hypothetical protein
MKKYVWLPLILIAVFGSAAVTAKAQSTRLRATVPFDFIVGDKPVSAGKITVRNVSSSDFGPLAISNFEKSQHAMRIAHNLGSNAAEQSKLVFRKYGTRYYLAQIWIPGYQALEFSKSKSERAERVTMLSKNSTPELVTVSADLQ